MIGRFLTIAAGLVVLGGCAGAAPLARPFGPDSGFLSRYQYTVLLSDQTGQVQVVVAPAYQGRVMTSTAEGLAGPSLGWINYALIASGRNERHINAYGGEERLSLGPESGRYGLFFEPEAPMDAAQGQVPGPLDNQPWDVREKSLDHVVLHKRFELTNRAGTTLQMGVTRTVRLLQREQAWRELGMKDTIDPALRMVAYESSNQVTNVGRTAWRKQTGAALIRVVGMMNASAGTVVAAPAHAEDGPDVVGYMKADGTTEKGLIVSARNTKGVVGSYDATIGALTIVQFMPIVPDGRYDHSDWQYLESESFAVRVRDGGTGPGEKRLPGCYELETSSPLLELGPGQSGTHVRRTYHLRGPAAVLDAVARNVLGVGIDEMRAGTKQ